MFFFLFSLQILDASPMETIVMGNNCKFAIDGVQIQDGVVGIPIAIVIDPDMARNAMEIAIPHASGDGHSIPNILALAERLIQGHAQEINAIVEGANEEVHLKTQIQTQTRLKCQVSYIKERCEIYGN